MGYSLIQSEMAPSLIFTYLCRLSRELEEENRYVRSSTHSHISSMASVADTNPESTIEAALEPLNNSDNCDTRSNMNDDSNNNAGTIDNSLTSSLASISSTSPYSRIDCTSGSNSINKSVKSSVSLLNHSSSCGDTSPVNVLSSNSNSNGGGGCGGSRLSSILSHVSHRLPTEMWNVALTVYQPDVNNTF